MTNIERMQAMTPISGAIGDMLTTILGDDTGFLLFVQNGNFVSIVGGQNADEQLCYLKRLVEILEGKSPAPDNIH